MRKIFAPLSFAVIAAFFACFLFWPICQTLRGAFFNADGAFTLAYARGVFANPIYLEGLRNAFTLAVASTLLTFAIAMPLAFVSGRFLFPGRKLFSALILIPMILPPFVGAIGIQEILGQMGALNALLAHLGILRADQTIDWLGRGRFWGIVGMNALHLYPILYLNLSAAQANIDPAMEEAAENIGCTGLRKFFKITLPLIMPGLFAGGTIVFIWAFTELGVPLMFDYSRVTPVQIFLGIKEISGNPMPYALVVVTLASTSLLYLVSKLLFGRAHYAMASKATTAGGDARVIGRGPAWLCTALFAGVTCIALLPHAGVVLVSFAGDWYHTVLPDSWTLIHYKNALGHDLTVPSIINSLKYASLATVFDLILGVAIAIVIVRSDSPLRHLLDAVAMLPLAIPGLVLAFGYIAMTQQGKVFAFLNPTRDPTPLLVIAYAVRRLPFVVRSTVAGLQQTSYTLEEAAQNLGASPLRALRKITIPLITANILAGGLLAFSFAMLEVSDSLILAQRSVDFPITKAIFELYQLLGEGRYIASALGVWAMVFLGITILAASRLLGKKMGALFRV